MTDYLQEELAFYRENQEALATEYDGRVLIIRGHSVVGVHNSIVDAYTRAAEDYEVGTFLLQEVCERGREEVAYISRVTFP